MKCNHSSPLVVGEVNILEKGYPICEDSYVSPFIQIFYINLDYISTNFSLAQNYKIKMSRDENRIYCLKHNLNLIKLTLV